MYIKKSVLCVLIGIVVCTCGVFVGRAFSQEAGDFNSISFVSDDTILKFFDHDSGKIYIYSSKSGDLIKAWVLQELGEDLIKFNPKIPGHLEQELERRGYR